MDDALNAGQTREPVKGMHRWAAPEDTSAAAAATMVTLRMPPATLRISLCFSRVYPVLSALFSCCRHQSCPK